VSGIAWGDGFGGQLSQVAPESRIFGLEQELDARILQHHPEIVNQSRMRVQTK